MMTKANRKLADALEAALHITGRHEATGLECVNLKTLWQIAGSKPKKTVDCWLLEKGGELVAVFGEVKISVDHEWAERALAIQYVEWLCPIFLMHMMSKHRNLEQQIQRAAGRFMRGIGLTDVAADLDEAAKPELQILDGGKAK